MSMNVVSVRLLFRYILIWLSLALTLTITYSALFMVVVRYSEPTSYNCGAMCAVLWTTSVMSMTGTDIVLESVPGIILTIITTLTGLALIFGALIPLSFMAWDEFMRRRGHPTSTRLSGHAIICYFNQITETLVSELTSYNIPFVVLDPREEVIEELVERGVPCVLGDPTKRDALKNAGLMNAKGVIAAGSDMQNVSIILLSDRPTWVVAEEKSSVGIFTQLGAQEVFLPKQVLADHIASKIFEIMGSAPIGEVELFEGLYISEIPVIEGSDI
ncbi:MAG: potassium channel family protein, partial [Methermicoccaceae archaeon]